MPLFLGTLAYALAVKRPRARRQIHSQNPCLHLFVSVENACTIPFALARIRSRRWKGLDIETDTEETSAVFGVQSRP